ncbi:hypothetical protein KI688_006594 [Linnemannia hyalina]|uniref:DUF676 domain-containing protein n=1 Tax=Linnemannia hyalina TaxID=64524 RepID=A0A9P8BQU3_9FUNG|nr:hypothetical protein KI688_006594 [Linnemannia hyalina]
MTNIPCKSSDDSSSSEDFDLDAFMSKISDTPLGTGKLFHSKARPELSALQYTNSPWRNELYLWKWSNIFSLSRQLLLLLSTLPLIGLLCMPIINAFATVGLLGLVGFAVAANAWIVKKQPTSMEDRQLYEITRNELLKPGITKVVLIAHSQGGIIASQVIDHLLATEDDTSLGKLEVYTFGSAANHFNGKEKLHHIEHFANKGDFVAQTGVLAYKPLDRNRYDGQLYTNNATGHLLNAHYLRSTFANGNEAVGSRLASYLGGHV